MRRPLIALIAAALVALATIAPVSATSMCDSGRTYGSMHISMEARAGTLGPDVHPGMHMGFSECVRD